MLKKIKVTSVKKEKLNLLVNNQTILLHGLNFLTLLENLLKKKSIIVTDSTLNLITNKIYLNVNIFFQTKKILLFKKKTLKAPFKKVKPRSTKTFIPFILNQFKMFKNNLIVLHFNNLNLSVNKKLLGFLYKRLKKFTFSLFSRRLNLLVDFVKVLALYSFSTIAAKIVLLFLGQIFKGLTKKQHSTFIAFLKNLAKILVTDLSRVPFLNKTNRIKGVKFLINGKLKGKTRANSILIVKGLVPAQTISANIDFSKTHVFTVYGVFGFKIWIFR